MNVVLIWGLLLIAGSLANLVPALSSGVIRGALPSHAIRKAEKPKAFAFGIAMFSVLIAAGAIMIIVALLYR